MYGSIRSVLELSTPDRSPYVQGVKGEAEVEPPLLLGPQQRRGLQIQHLSAQSSGLPVPSGTPIVTLNGGGVSCRGTFFLARKKYTNE